MNPFKLNLTESFESFIYDKMAQFELK